MVQIFEYLFRLAANHADSLERELSLNSQLDFCISAFMCDFLKSPEDIFWASETSPLVLRQQNGPNCRWPQEQILNHRNREQMDPGTFGAFCRSIPVDQSDNRIGPERLGKELP